MSKDKRNTSLLDGFCYLYTDFDSSHYCFQDSMFVSPDGSMSYEGMHCLRDGDHLTIFSGEDKKTIIWSGEVKFVKNEGNRLSQRGVEGKIWMQWFKKEYPAEFIPLEKRKIG